MQPSSLVFVVVIGLWAAYLTQSWMRRREHLQTARAVERYAEAIRVLERRPVVPTSVTRSYAVSPLRARSADAADTTRRHTVDEQPGAQGRGSRIVRGISLGLVVVTTVVLVVLAVLRVLPVWTPAVGVALIGADLAWLRLSTKRTDRQVARATRTAERSAPAPVGATRVDAEAAAPVQEPEVVATAVETTSVADVPPVRSDMPFDVRVFDEPTVTESAEPVVEELEPGQWRPVPVPLPTYALKTSVARPAPEPLPVGEDLVPVEIEDDFLVDPAPLQRAVGG